MFCSSCGAKNVAESNFCRQCGRKLDKQAPNKISEEAFDRALPEEEQVTALLERAYRLRKANDLAGAIGLCKEVLDIRPDSTTAHGLLGQLYEQNGEHDKAVEQYERVLQLNPGSIADRVKLDDLREGGPRPAARNGTSKIVVIDPNGSPVRGAAFWAVGIGVLLILSGAALAIAFNQHNPPARSDGDLAARPPKGTASVDHRAGSEPTRVTPNAGQAQVQPGAGAATAPPGSAPGATNGAPTYSFAPPAIQYVPYVLPQPSSPSRLPGASPNAGSGPPRRPAKSTQQAERGPSDADQGSVRVHLDAADGSNGGDPHEPVITITRPGAGGAKPTPNQGTEGTGSIKVREHSEPVDPAASNAPSSEANAMISVGQEKLNKMDYAGAILAFKKALAGANDETGYVYEKMGACYSAKGDNKGAVSMYERARDEYKKLISAGRQVDRATEGIRICETGIKICSRE